MTSASVRDPAILRLNIPIALLATVLGTAASPFYIPALAASFGGYRLDIDPWQTCLHLVLLVGGAFVASVAAKRLASTFIRENPEAMTRYCRPGDVPGRDGLHAGHASPSAGAAGDQPRIRGVGLYVAVRCGAGQGRSCSGAMAGPRP
jgi:hypothetical protein